MLIFTVNNQKLIIVIKVLIFTKLTILAYSFNLSSDFMSNLSISNAFSLSLFALALLIAVSTIIFILIDKSLTSLSFTPLSILILFTNYLPLIHLHFINTKWKSFTIISSYNIKLMHKSKNSLKMYELFLFYY